MWSKNVHRLPDYLAHEQTRSQTKTKRILSAVKSDNLLTLCRNAYWGEYLLSFAACLGQEECVRLLCAKDADINLEDTNGNTALHMIVIHDNKVCDTTYHVCN